MVSGQDFRDPSNGQIRPEGEERREGKGREGKEREGKGREGKGREGKGREGKGREGKGREEAADLFLGEISYSPRWMVR